MTLQLTQGDLLQADAEAIVNTVNCVGFMGRGIAAQFKRRFPDNFRAYAAACKRSEVEPGRMLVFATGQLTNPRFIINFPTKRHWRGASRIEDIDSGLSALVKEVKESRSALPSPFHRWAAAWADWPGERSGLASSAPRRATPR